MAVELRPTVPLALYELHFTCGCRTGVRQVWAPDGPTASRLLRENASAFGLSHETVVVRRVIRLYLRAEGVRTPDERAA